MLDAQEACRFKAIVHTDNIALHCHVRRVIAANEVGEIDHPLRPACRHGSHHVIELGDIAADRLYSAPRSAKEWAPGFNPSILPTDRAEPEHERGGGR